MTVLTSSEFSGIFRGARPRRATPSSRRGRGDRSARPRRDQTAPFPFVDGGTQTPQGAPFIVNGTTGTPTSPVASVSPGTVAFGDVSSDADAQTEAVVITNGGVGTLTITSVTLSGDGSFSLDQSGLDTSLEPGESTSVEVTFTPGDDGDATGQIEIVSNDPNSPTTVDVTATVFSPPANDGIAGATEIDDDGTYTGTNVNATLAAGEPAASCTDIGATVWWTFTPSADGIVGIDLSGSDFDTVVTVHQPGTTEIACNDDAGGRPSSIVANVAVTAGEPVLIRVGGFAGPSVTATGSISFEFDFNAGSAVSTALAGGNTTGGPAFARPFTVGDGTSGSCLTSGTGTAVPVATETLRIGTDGFYTVTVQTPNHAGYVHLYDGSFDPADSCANLIALNFGGAESSISANLDAGDYVLVVDGFANTDVGPYTGTVLGPAAVSFVVAVDEDPVLGTSTLTTAPNPATGSARVRLSVDTPREMTVAVYDALGREVARLHDGPVSGTLDLRLDASALPSGVYVVRATGESTAITERLTVVR